MEVNAEVRPTVFVVDDDVGVRNALSLFFSTTDLVARTYASAQDFLNEYQPEWPGCLVLDVRMPDMSGLELQHMLTAQVPGLPIIFITGHGDVPMAVGAVQAGAIDFLQKPFHNRQLLASVRRALAHDQRTRQEYQAQLSIRERHRGLTPREREVMALLIQGKSTRQIASLLRTSPRTIEVHRYRVMAKMAAQSLPDITAMAVRCGLYEGHRAT